MEDRDTIESLLVDVGWGGRRCHAFRTRWGLHQPGSTHPVAKMSLQMVRHLQQASQYGRPHLEDLLQRAIECGATTRTALNFVRDMHDPGDTEDWTMKHLYLLDRRRVRCLMSMMAQHPEYRGDEPDPPGPTLHEAFDMLKAL